jgi:hypothetical protein
VRNDLSDSDLEVVRAIQTTPAGGSATVPSAEPVALTPPELDGLVWNHLKTQLFGAEKA